MCLIGVHLMGVRLVGVHHAYGSGYSRPRPIYGHTYARGSRAQVSIYVDTHGHGGARVQAHIYVHIYSGSGARAQVNVHIDTYSGARARAHVHVYAIPGSYINGSSARIARQPPTCQKSFQPGILARYLRLF
jgi:hypothetical protein